MADNGLDKDSPAVVTHVQVTQAVIQRMAGNSASCKTWVITLVSGILVVAGQWHATYFIIALVPTILFFGLDTYYLALERMFRRTYNSFVDKLHAGTAESSDVYQIPATGVQWIELKAALRSLSVWPFYLTLAILIVIARVTIAHN